MARPVEPRRSSRRAWAVGLVLVVALVAVALWFSPARGSKVEVPKATAETQVEAETREVAAPRNLRAEVLEVYPHDPAAFTQGLLWHEGWIYESTGLNGQSSLRRVRLDDGAVDLRKDLEYRFFGEGLARIDRQLYQLTWRAGVLLRYDLETFEAGQRLTYSGPGWGLCFDGESLVRSDGSDRLFFHEPARFDLVRTLDVRAGDEPVGGLNELECAEGWIYANVINTDSIVRIDPASGQLDAVIDASGLLSAEERATADVLNGIAYYPPNESFLVTGKLWPKLFEVVFVAR